MHRKRPLVMSRRIVLGDMRRTCAASATVRMHGAIWLTIFGTTLPAQGRLSGAASAIWREAHRGICLSLELVSLPCVMQKVLQGAADIASSLPELRLARLRGCLHEWNWVADQVKFGSF